MLYPGYVFPFYFIVCKQANWLGYWVDSWYRDCVKSYYPCDDMVESTIASVWYNVSGEYRFISCFCQLTWPQSASGPLSPACIHAVALPSGWYWCEDFFFTKRRIPQSCFANILIHFSQYRNVFFSSTDGAPISCPCFCPIFQICHFNSSSTLCSPTIWGSKMLNVKCRIFPLLVSAGISFFWHNLSTDSLPIFWDSAAVLVKTQSFVMFGWPFISLGGT